MLFLGIGSSFICDQILHSGIVLRFLLLEFNGVGGIVREFDPTLSQSAHWENPCIGGYVGAL